MIVLVNAAEMALAIKLRPNHRTSHHRYGLMAGFRDNTHNEGPLDVVNPEKSLVRQRSELFRKRDVHRNRNDKCTFRQMIRITCPWHYLLKINADLFGNGQKGFSYV
jgi:hypothetical protein